MAERRMFSKRVIDNDSFIDMPATARLLYYDLGMRADDEGFVNNPKGIARLTGASKDDLNILASKGFIILFESGVIVLRHWRLNNYIRPDRLTETVYKRERDKLTEGENGIYDLLPGNDGQATDKRLTHDGQTTDTRPPSDGIGKDSIGKYSIVEDSEGKDSIEKKSPDGLKEKKSKKEKSDEAHRFRPPSFEEVKEYCNERGNNIDPQSFIDFYTSKGWLIGKVKMKDWRAAVRTWERRNREEGAEGRPRRKTEAEKLDDFYNMVDEWATAEEGNV